MGRSPARKSAADTERLHLQLDRRWVKALRREAADHRMTLRALVERCIADRYDPERKQVGERWVAKELQRLRREVGQVSFGNAVVVELFTLTARNLMTRLPAPTPASELAGESFHEALVSEVTECFARDTPLLERLIDTLKQEAADAVAATTDAPAAAE